MTSMSEIAKENIESKKTVSSDTDSSIKRFEERLKIKNLKSKVNQKKNKNKKKKGLN